MGVGVSNWRLAQAVSRIGQLGIVSGTGLDQVLARRLQDGDKGGECRRALSHFPFPQMAQRIQEMFFVPGGKSLDQPYKSVAQATIKNHRWLEELYIAGNFVEVFLAREGHSNPVGINYLEKIQLPHLPSIYGAMLAGAAVVIMGAGIPLEIPLVLDRMANHESTSYTIRVTGATPDTDILRTFDPADFIESGVSVTPLYRPDFLPIIASDSLATMMLRRAGGSIEGFVIETPLAGGHNAPPRGPMKLSDGGEPIYGARDLVNYTAIAKFGLPFWLGGAYGSPEKIAEAEELGAAGVQVGTPFALCEESGIDAASRDKLIRMALDGTAYIKTDPVASPTGFPFKVAKLEGSLSEEEVFLARRRRCDIGYLREPYRRDDGTVGYRCPSEPIPGWLAKGGSEADTIGRKCICNGLFAGVELGQVLPDGYREPPIITLGDDYLNIGRLCSADNTRFTAADVVNYLLGNQQQT